MLHSLPSWLLPNIVSAMNMKFGGEFRKELISLRQSELVKDRGFLWVEFLYPYPYPPKPLPLAKGMGFPGVRGQVFAKWWGGEHHCGRCNYHPPGYSLSENILYNV